VKSLVCVRCWSGWPAIRAKRTWSPYPLAVRLELDHYLEALLRKPGALPGATVLEQARAAGRYIPVHDDW
jgi:hypothetical protein